MISSAIWDKSAEVNFSKTNKIARARREIAICGLEKFTSAGLSQSAREKSCDYLIIIYTACKNLTCAFPLLRVTSHHLSQLPVPAYK